LRYGKASRLEESLSRRAWVGEAAPQQKPLAPGGPFRAETFKPALEKVLAKAGVAKRPRPFHDARHGALTAMAATGASPIAVMTTAGHASMQTTKRYLHLAGTVFQEEAAALERRLGLSTELSTDLSESQSISGDSARSVSGLET
jgi:integrase